MTHAYVADVMTTDVVTVRTDASYRDLAAGFRAHRVSGFPVLDADGKVVGVVSESDLLPVRAPHLLLPVRAPDLPAAPGPAARRAARLAHPAFHHRPPAAAATPTAADLMTHPAVTIGPEEPVRRAAELMSARQLRRLPVVDRAGHLVGMLSRSDVLAAFARPDEQIRREVVQDVITDGFFLDPAPLTVTVQDGVVTLAGHLGSAVLGRNIADQVRRLDGVVAVRDRFRYPHPVRSQ